jgi:hypothetical protein
MSDTSPDGDPHRSALDRAREDREQFPLRGQTYAMSMQMARDMRRARAQAAAGQAIGQARELALRDPAQQEQADPMWELRGEPRTRATFAAPHPDDFPGGLPIPDEFPVHIAVPNPRV